MATTAHQHPYWPPDLSLPGFEPPRLHFSSVLAVFFGGSGALLSAGWLLSGVWIVG